MKRTIQWVLALGVLGLGGCSSVPTFDERVRPIEPICSDEGSPGPCPGGQLCLSGRCFEGCVSDTECASRESCEDGICVGTGRGIDGGMFDANTPVMPCDGTCGVAEVCDIRTDQCVSCFDERQCSGDEPVCDYARGQCVAAQGGEACRPCNESADCTEGRSCVLRTDFTERVCLMPCSVVDDTCPSGFICNTADEICEPPLGGCTQLRRALDATSCVTDVDCVARRETAEPGTCNGPVEMRTCRAACQTEAGCPGGWTCDGMYCQPPVTM